MKKIKLTQGKWALVDDGDYERVNKHKWRAVYDGWNWYAKTSIPTGLENPRHITISMHRFVLKLHKGDGKRYDHHNHNGLDNRRCNLRKCTSQQNGFNMIKRRISSSKYKGVSKEDKKWRAQISINQKKTYLGIFTTEIEAAKTYDKTAKKYFGKFAHLNFPETTLAAPPQNTYTGQGGTFKKGE